jgi:hypothetical protein
MDYTLLIPNLIHHPKEDLIFKHMPCSTGAS